MRTEGTRRRSRGLSKEGLVLALARRLDVPHRTATAFVEAFLKTATEALRDGKRVPLGKVGMLHPVTLGKKKGRNLHTGEPVMVPPRPGVVLRMGKRCKASLNG